ncbi:MAG: hypothetical protein KatS3mg099_323 [Candidatus Parcubacteria bacterium]|nr:MAG: hypothetical protein KatS3mg099_323 [Candidatus Parcubacteria bacterium]
MRQVLQSQRKVPERKAGDAREMGALWWLTLAGGIGILLAWTSGFSHQPFATAALAAEQGEAIEAAPQDDAELPGDVRISPLIDQGVFRDFVVGPGKYEVYLEPGEGREFSLSVSNRMGDDRGFLLTVEDVTGDPTGKEPVVLLGNDRGPYSLRNWVHPAAWEITIPHGHKAVIPVRISVPSDASPGGYYGSLLVSTVSKDSDTPEGGIAGATKVVSRIGVLLFVRVPGEVVEKGSLVSFSTKERKALLTHGDPLTFLITFRNEGNVHLNPSATLTIQNVLGKTVHEIVVPPWYVLPNAMRTREVAWEVPYWLGRYTATLTLNSGYEGAAPKTAQIVFWVVSWQAIAVVVGVFVLALILFLYLPRRYAIVRKQ